MKTVDWAGIMRLHPVFALLSEEDRDRLLHPEVSSEVTYEQDAVMIRQGELGRSVFLLGPGAAVVKMQRSANDIAELYTIGYGELFGEMALIEERPRAASVLALETSKALEIDGVTFIDLLKSQPEIAFMLLGKLSRRLRFTNTKVMEQRISGLDETVSVMNSRVDSMLAKTEAHLEAAKVVFEQTKQSANEVVESGERKQAILTRVGTIGALILTIAASFGFWDMRDTAASFDKQSDQVQEQVKDVNEKLADIEKKADQVTATLERLGSIEDEAKQVIGSLEEQLTSAKEIGTRANDVLTSTTLRITTFEEKIDARLVLSELGSLDDLKADSSGEIRGVAFTSEQLRRLRTLVQLHDEDDISELGQLFTGFLADGMRFHQPLAELLRNSKLTNPKGIVFLTYFGGLSALRDLGDDSAYGQFRNALESFASDSGLRNPWLVTEDDRDVLKFVMAANEEDPSRIALIERRVDLLVDHMQDLAER
ncbi:MAG: cyclic nucleotide-binding domain-containing protein [Pseudomonadota bacterium]